MLRIHIASTQCIVPKRQSYLKISTLKSPHKNVVCQSSINAFNFFTQNVHIGSRFAIDTAYKLVKKKKKIFYHQFHCDTLKNVICG